MKKVTHLTTFPFFLILGFLILYNGDVNAQNQINHQNLKNQPPDSGGFVNGMKDGIWKEYYLNGNVRRIFQYTKGKKNGIVKTFYENGVLQSDGTFVNDTIGSNLKSYWPNGQLEVDGTINKDGHYIGFYKRYSKTGQIAEIGNYINEEKEGEWITN